jgi:uncharacterized cupin superfamily protein
MLGRRGEKEAGAVNLYGNEWDVERAPTGYGEKLMHLGRRLGGELIGATMFEVEPGWRSLYHVHHGNEELVLVVDGNPTVRTSGGERELKPGDAVLFKRGLEGAHSISNRSDQPARFVIFSSMVSPDVVELPEAGIVGAFAGGVPTSGRDAELELFVKRDSALGYFDIPREDF